MIVMSGGAGLYVSMGITKKKANLLELHVDLARLSFAGIADDNEIRAAHLDPLAGGGRWRCGD
jgi:hypothetical protein